MREPFRGIKVVPMMQSMILYLKLRDSGPMEGLLALGFETTFLGFIKIDFQIFVQDLLMKEMTPKIFLSKIFSNRKSLRIIRVPRTKVSN